MNGNGAEKEKKKKTALVPASRVRAVVEVVDVNGCCGLTGRVIRPELYQKRFIESEQNGMRRMSRRHPEKGGGEGGERENSMPVLQPLSE